MGVDQSLTRAVEIQKIQKNMKPWHSAFVSHLLPIQIKKLELQHMIHIRLCKNEQEGRRFIACKANELDHDHGDGKHCPNGLKFGTWVHLGMPINLHIGCS